MSNVKYPGVFFAATRRGVATYLELPANCGGLWLAPSVLSQWEVESLRAQGLSITVFAREQPIEEAVHTIREHHPVAAVWVETLPEQVNPRSADVGQAFLWREFIVGAKFEHNALVKITEGEFQGKQGSVVALVQLQPEPLYVVELESGADTQVYQSRLAHGDA